MIGIKRILAFSALTIALACSGDDHPTAPASSGPRMSMNGASVTADTGPTIATDKEDYVPHEPVLMIGSGWEPGETVTLTLVEDPHMHGDRSFTVSADSLGSFAFDGFAPEDHDAGVAFVLTAVGQSSGLTAETRFTDSVASDFSSSNTNGTGLDNPSRLMLSAPATVAGDLLIAQVTVAKDIPSNEVICPPSGWTSILKTRWSDGSTSKINQEIFYHVTTSAEVMQTYTWVFKQNNDCNGTNSPARGAAGGIIRYTGVDVTPATDAIRGFAGAGTGSGSSTTATAPAVSGAVTGDRVLRFFGAFKNTRFTPSSGRFYTVGSGNNSTERAVAAFDANQGADGGTGTFNATLASSAEWLAQTVVLRMAVACTAPAITAQPVSATKTVGEPVTFSVTATGTGLSYQWRKNGAPIGSATSSSYTIASVTTGDAGSYDVVITGTCGSVTSNAATLTVNQRASMTAVTSSANPSVFGQSVMFQATVSPTSGSGTPTGNVTFIEGGTCASPTTTHAGPVALSGGQASFNTGGLSVGSHTITACYAGNTEFGSSPGSAVQTVNNASTSTALGSDVNPSVFGQSVTFTATVSVASPGSGTPIGNVVFKEGTCAAGTALSSPVALLGGVATFDTAALDVTGSPHTITVCYGGNASFLASDGDVAQVIEQAYTTTSITSLSPSGSQYVNGQVTVSFGVSVVAPGSGTPTGDVEVKNGTAVLCSAALPATSCSFTPTAVAALSLVAAYEGDANFRSSGSAASSYLVKYNFLGFFAPVDRPNTLNVAKAGQAVPLKWRLLDANGDPVSDLTAVNLKIGTLSCSTSSSTDLIEEYAAGSSGLQNMGDGYYQFNWKTPTTYANSCRTVGLDFGSGYLEYPLANFNFKK